MKTDLVITYVNSRDEVWRNQYINYCINHNKRNKIVNITRERYSGVNWLEYQLKLVKKNMKFINNIFLVVSNIEQIKDIKLDDNVKVVLHNEIIPYRYLPTFNSTTIEMFLFKIKGLNEQFIYANDDMLPLKELKEEDFFNNGKIRLNFFEEEFNGGVSEFKYQCYNGFYLLSNRLKKSKDKYKYLRPQHTMIPMIKTHCEECFELIKDKICTYISAFRNEYNFNQYIFPCYEYLKYGVEDNGYQFLYTELLEEVDIGLYDIICVNAELNKTYTELLIEGVKQLCE